MGTQSLPDTPGSVEADDPSTGQSFDEEEFSEPARYDHGLSWRIFAGIGGLFYGLAQFLCRDVSREFSNTMIAARLYNKVSPSLYIPGALGTGLIFGFLSGLGAAALTMVVVGIESGIIVAGVGLAIFVITSRVVYSLILRYPSRVAQKRNRSISLGVSDVVAFMYTLSASDMNIINVIKAAGQAETEYGEVAVEFRRITNRMENLGADYRSAIQHVQETTPSEPLSRFLTDLLSVMDSGGDITEHLEHKKDDFAREAERQQEKQLNQMEGIGEVYLVGKTVPMLLTVLVVVMMFSGSASILMLQMVVGIIPLLGLSYIVMISTVTADSVGSGRVELIEGRSINTNDRLRGAPVLSKYADERPELFEDAYSRELSYKWRRALRSPVSYLKQHPRESLKATVPLALLTLGALVATGYASLSPTKFLTDPNQTIIWVCLPTFIVLLPIAIFHEIGAREKRRVLSTLTQNLRNLAETNRVRGNLRATFAKVGKDGDTYLSKQLGKIETARSYGVPLRASVSNLANRYESPRLGRTMKIVQKVQEADQQISEAIETAAELSERQDDMMAKKRAKTSIQAVIVSATFMVLVGIVMVLLVFFNPVIEAASQASQGAQGQGQSMLNMSLNQAKLRTVYIHIIVADALVTGVVAGYIQSADGEWNGIAKYVLAFLALGLIAWFAVPALLGGPEVGGI